MIAQGKVKRVPRAWLPPWVAWRRKHEALKGRNTSWQNGYGAFSIGQSQSPDLKHYIANQREHHRRLSFQEEYRQILAKYDMEYDERSVWD